MTVYVAEILGRGVVAFDAADEADARARLEDRSLRRDLIVHQSEGRPLWDGVSEILVRAALRAEAESWQTSRALAVQSGKSAEGEEWRIFLVTVVDPSSKRFDDDDDDDDDDDGD
jgi:hypothetical protein